MYPHTIEKVKPTQIYDLSSIYIYKNEKETKLWVKYFISFNQHYFIFDGVYIIAKTLGIPKAGRHM